MAEPELQFPKDNIAIVIETQQRTKNWGEEKLTGEQLVCAYRSYGRSGYLCKQEKNSR